MLSVITFLYTKVDKRKVKKGKFVPANAVKVYTESRVRDALTLSLGIRQRCFVSYIPQPLYPQERSLMPTER